MHNKITCSLPNNPARCTNAPQKPEAKNKNVSNRRGNLVARRHKGLKGTEHTEARKNAVFDIQWSVWQDLRHRENGREVSQTQRNINRDTLTSTNFPRHTERPTHAVQGEGYRFKGLGERVKRRWKHAKVGRGGRRKNCALKRGK